MSLIADLVIAKARHAAEIAKLKAELRLTLEAGIPSSLGAVLALLNVVGALVEYGQCDTFIRQRDLSGVGFNTGAELVKALYKDLTQAWLDVVTIQVGVGEDGRISIKFLGKGYDPINHTAIGSDGLRVHLSNPLA